MNVQIAVLCDAATDYGGKLNLLGAFDTIATQQLPAVHPQCSVALRIVFSKVEEGPHKVKMNFVDEDGRFVMPSIDMPAEVALPPDANFVARNFIINIQQLKFEKPGQYAIDLAIDGRQESSIPLHVNAAAEPGLMLMAPGVIVPHPCQQIVEEKSSFSRASRLRCGRSFGSLLRSTR